MPNLNWRSVNLRFLKVFDKKLKSYFLCVLITLLLSTSLLAQNPSFFVLGQAELENTEVYSILQTQDKKLYVATNEGLYQYKHGRMTVIPNAKDQKGFEVFDLIANSKNEVYCYNLAGQILRIVGNKLEVFKQIPSQFINDRISMVFDKKDRLIFASNGCFFIQEDMRELYFSEENQVLGVNVLIDGRIVFTQNNSENVLVLNGDSVQPIKTSSHLSTSSISNQNNLLMNNKIVRSIDIAKQLSERYNKKLKSSWNYSYTQISENEIWGTSRSGGIDIIRKENEEWFIAASYFEDTFISEVAQGENGLILLGTFGKGVLVLPQLSTRRHHLSDLGTNLRRIATDSQGNVFLTDATNGVLHYKENARILDDDFSSTPDKIFHLEQNNVAVNEEFPKLFYKRYINYGAIKDVYEVDENTLLVATSKGIAKIDPNRLLDGPHWELKDAQRSLYTLKQIDERCQTVAFHKVTKNLYVATLSRLLVMGTKGAIQELKYEDEPIAVNKLLLVGNQLWCATQNYGVLVFEDGEIVKKIGVAEGLESNYIHKFYNDKNSLYILHKEGFQIVNIATDKIETLGIAEGIADGSMRDFSVMKDKIWYISSDQLFSTPIAIEDKEVNYTITIDSVVVSGLKVDESKQGDFKHNQNQLVVFMDFRGISYEKETLINYKLSGFDTEWRIAKTTDQSISYKFLPPGTYDLELNTQYRCVTNNAFSYSFTVQKPYWQQWWFLLISIAILAMIIALIFSVRMRSIKKRASEKLERQHLKSNLIETELKAMRSQMNPHFIFNALNSIQDLILQEDTDASYDYIVLFSYLVRNTLHYSNENFIPIAKETKFLETYLKLEALRFDDSFAYSIQHNHITDVSIPSLILQPFVENAIVHGLFHKEGPKELKISFVKQGEFIECVILDNGVGRQKAAAIQGAKGNVHKSFALETIEKRLKILQKKYGIQVGYTIKDLFNGMDPMGTEVRIILPFLD